MATDLGGDPPTAGGDGPVDGAPLQPDERGRALDDGGDAVCWLERVCDACGGLADGAPQAVCERCGTPRDDGPAPQGK